MESFDEGNSTASTVGGENDSSSSVGQHSDSETPRKGPFCDDEASEAACSLASMLMSIQNVQAGKRASKSQPASAPGGLEVRPKSSSSSVSGDDNDENSGDTTLEKKQRRREKNRASAQQSRQRKKYHLEKLETRVEELERDKAQLLARVEALTAENRRLRAGAGGVSGDVDAEANLKSDDIVAAASCLKQFAQVCLRWCPVSACLCLPLRVRLCACASSHLVQFAQAAQKELCASS